MYNKNKIKFEDVEDLIVEYETPSTTAFTCVKLFLVSVTIIFAVSLAVFLLYYIETGPCCQNGAVSSSNVYASEVGIEVLKRGGNAIDAMVAMQAVLSVTEPFASGIGGGLFLMYYNQSLDEVISIDGREEAPMNIKEYPTSRSGGSQSGVPGTVQALVTVLNRYGTWSLEDCFIFAVSIARKGYKMNEYMYSRLLSYEHLLSQFPSTKDIYFRDGKPINVGEVVYNPDIADILEDIAKDYGNSFYNGPIAQDIVDCIQNDTVSPGIMEVEDLRSYRAVEREPIVFDFMGYQIYGFNMPSSGGVTSAIILGILEDMDIGKVGSVKSVSTFLNAIAIAFADRDMYMADADWVDVPVDGLLDPDYIKSRKSLLLNTSQTDVPYGNPTGAPNHTSVSEQDESMLTTHFVIGDTDGNIVSCTSTIENTWGSQLVVPGHGFLLNNELGDFSKTGANKVEGGKKPRKTATGPFKNTLGGKRPRSSMTPTIIFKDGKPVYALGSPGGSRIISTVTSVIFNILHYGMDIQSSVDQARFSGNNAGGWRFEQGLLHDNFVQGMKDLGFSISNSSGYEAGSVSILTVDEHGKFDAVADRRRPGKSIVL
eukprot:TRINITY_DN6624_c0_g4_i1.p1 TRINITY_DN6624_c0_g4~~TRINITY_DN6624_c0_g4_i1.p1  ORF type:complete len:597 (+),score=120.02 TRINITY_DN6624_c0_g4_i1:15-1805(+)